MRPALSVLIPAYEYAEGVERILRRLELERGEDFEVLVADDSASDAVEQVVSWHRRSGFAVDYVRNSPALGPAANWNALLSRARGRYSLILHHDEFPVTNGLVGGVVAEVNRSRADILILGCTVVELESQRSRRCAPGWLRAWVSSVAPRYLFVRNVLGPTSVLAVRRGCYAAFDPELRWYVDVDAYVRMLSRAPTVRIRSDLRIASVARRDGTVTASLSGELAAVMRREAEYLRTRQAATPPRFVDGPGPVCAGLRLLESTAWASVRAGQWCWGTFTGANRRDAGDAIAAAGTNAS